MIVASNKPFGRWGEVFGDEIVAAVMIDRLVHHADVIALKGDCYRLKNRDIGRTTAPPTTNHRRGSVFTRRPRGPFSAVVDGRMLLWLKPLQQGTPPQVPPATVEAVGSLDDLVTVIRAMSVDLSQRPAAMGGLDSRAILGLDGSMARGYSRSRPTVPTWSFIAKMLAVATVTNSQERPRLRPLPER